MSFDLFSNLDFSFPVSFFFIWVFSFLWVIMTFSLNSSNFFKSILFVVKNFFKSFYSSFYASFYVYKIFMISLFPFIFISKFWSIVSFSWTPHIIATFSLSLIFWGSVNFSKISFSFMKFCSHLTPLASPLYLTKFLNMVEFISKLIRPLTLSLRLSINLTTGHIFIALLACVQNYWLLYMFSGYMLFECGICLIQGFVFNLLKIQYLGEHI